MSLIMLVKRIQRGDLAFASDCFFALVFCVLCLCVCIQADLICIHFHST